MQKPSYALPKRFFLLFWVGVCMSCGYRWVGAEPATIACLSPVENLSNEVGAGQVFDVALRSRLGKAGGLGREGEASGKECLRARLMQVSQIPLTQATHFQLTAVLELSLAKEGFHPIRVMESEEFSRGADILLTEASMRAALARLAEKTAQKGFEHMQMQWHPSP
jgi:hypothetical protein